MGKNYRVRAFRFFFVFFMATVLLFSSIARLEKADVIKGELRLHFAGNYDKKQIHKFALTHPNRLIFDFKNAHLVHKNMSKRLDNSIRIAQYKPDIVRVVIQSTTPYNCMSYQPFFSKTYYHIPLPRHPISLPAKRYKKPKLNIKIKSALKERVAVKSIPTVLSIKKDDLIVIDAGHGGHDTGAIGAGKREKNLVLQIAKKLERKLRKDGHPVYMTRTKDNFLTLRQRTKIADKKNAKVFISIHANAVAKKSRNKVYGIETFFLQNTRDAKSQRIAARENKAVLQGTTKLSQNVIIDSVLSGPKIVQSNKLAIDVQKRMITNLRSKYKNIKDGGVRNAPFWVLVGASRPSILVEVGYISHPMERKRLFNPHYQDLLVQGIAEGIDNYLDNRKKEIDF